MAFSFLDNAPPEKEFAREKFPLVIVAENRGATTVPAGELKLILSGAKDWGLDSKAPISDPKSNIRRNTAPLEGRQITLVGTVTPGTKEELDYGEILFNKAQPAEEEEKPIILEACYTYQTILQAPLCAATRGGTCEPTAPKTFYSSSAPVQVTEYKQLSAKKVADNKFDLKFSFKIKNAASGGRLGGLDCEDTFAVNRGHIHHTQLSFPGTPGPVNYICRPDFSDITLSDQDTEVTCTIQNVDITQNAEEPLVLKFDYVYTETVKTSIIIIPTK